MMRDGYTRVECTHGAFNVALNEYDAVLTAWKERQPFYEGRDPYGDLITFSCDAIVAVRRNTAEGLAAFREEERLEKIEGLTE